MAVYTTFISLKLTDYDFNLKPPEFQELVYKLPPQCGGGKLCQQMCSCVVCCAGAGVQRKACRWNLPMDSVSEQGIKHTPTLSPSLLLLQFHFENTQPCILIHLHPGFEITIKKSKQERGQKMTKICQIWKFRDFVKWSNEVQAILEGTSFWKGAIEREKA